ncbi:MAG: lysophospholipid acyltransferase family protein [Pseudomonadota bacterium]
MPELSALMNSTPARTARAVVRGARLVIHLAIGLLLGVALMLDRWNRLNAQALMSWWCQVALGIFSIELIRNGAPHIGGRITVANHVSWLDIIVIGASEPTRFVAKSEIQNWPIAGSLADACGTFYIRRGKGGSRPLLDKLVPHLKAGGCVTIFPEGTTTDGRSVLPFHARLFAAAIEAQCVVQPVALRYGLSASGDNIAPFIGDDDLVSHVLRMLKEPEIVVEVNYGAVLSSEGRTREELAEMTQTSITKVVMPTQRTSLQPSLETELESALT